MIGGYLELAFWLAFGAGWLMLIAREFLRRRSAGDILLDLGGSGRSDTQALLGIAFIVWGAFMEARGHRPRGLQNLACGTFFLLAPRRHYQICESDILGQRLILWDEIVTYFLEPTGVLRLKLRDHVWTIGGSTVPPELRQEVSQLLATRLPGAQLQID